MKEFKFILLLSFCLFTKNVLASNDTIQQTVDVYISQAKFDSAKDYIIASLETEKVQENIDYLKYQLVKILFIQSDYNEALKQAFTALDEIGNKQERVKFNFIIGCIYSAISDFEKSLDYFDLVIDESKDSTLTVQTHLLSSELYLELKDSTNALISLQEAYNISEGSNLDPKVKNHVAIQYNFHSQNYELCKQQNLQIIVDTTSFVSAKSFALSMIGECLIKQDSLLEATKYLNSFLELTFKTKDPEQVKIAANKLIEVYERLGDQQKANAYHKIYNEAENDSLSFSIEKYRALYDLEKSRELSITQSNFLKTSILLGTGAFLLILLGTYYYYTSILKKKAASNLKKTSGKKIVINQAEIEKIKSAIDQLIEKQLFLKPKITRKSFCSDHKIKSERYVSHYINEEYKKSFSVFLNDLRIEYAYNRIQNDHRFTQYTIEEIAKASGFGSKKSFERVFLAKYGVTPYKLILSITG